MLLDDGDEEVAEAVEEVEVHGASHLPVFSFHEDSCQSVDLDGVIHWWLWVWACDRELEAEVLVEQSEEEALLVFRLKDFVLGWSDTEADWGCSSDGVEGVAGSATASSNLLRRTEQTT